MKKPRYICVQSSYTPPGWQEATYNDLAALHAGRTAKSFKERLTASINEITNQ